MRIKTTNVIFFISISFALLHGAGVYGFGGDYYSAYYKNNLLGWGGIRDQLGFLLATLTIYNLHIGVYLTSYLLAISTGLLLYRSIYFILKKVAGYFSSYLF